MFGIAHSARCLYGGCVARRAWRATWVRPVGVTAALVVIVAIALAVVAAALPASPASPGKPGTPSPSPPLLAIPTAPPSPAQTPVSAIDPPADLPVVDYWPSPVGFPTDPEPLSTVRLTEGLRPGGRIAAYDALGGQPRAFLDPTIRGVALTLPIVERRSGWAAVLLPSVNRTIGWVPPGSWTTVSLRDQIIVVRSTHTLHWLRDGALERSWPVSLGAAGSPTPLGRTFVLGRSRLPGSVYADTDVWALGAVPDDPYSVPPGLRGAHTGLHTWYHDGELGKNTTNGCIRLTKSGQQLLLQEIVPGTEVLVVNQLSTPEPRRGPESRN